MAAAAAVAVAVGAVESRRRGWRVWCHTVLVPHRFVGTLSQRLCAQACRTCMLPRRTSVRVCGLDDTATVLRVYFHCALCQSI